MEKGLFQVLAELFEQINKFVSTIDGMGDTDTAKIISVVVLLIVVLVFFAVTAMVIRTMFSVLGLRSRLYKFDPFADIQFPYASRGSVIARWFLAIAGTNYEAFTLSPYRDRLRKIMLSAALIVSFTYMSISYFLFVAVGTAGELEKVFEHGIPWRLVGMCLFVSMAMLMVDISILIGSNSQGVSSQNNKSMSAFGFMALFLRISLAVVVGFFASSVITVYLLKAEGEKQLFESNKEITDLNKGISENENSVIERLASIKNLENEINLKEKRVSCLGKVMATEAGKEKKNKGELICDDFKYSGSHGTQEYRKDGKTKSNYALARDEMERLNGELPGQRQRLSELNKGLSDIRDDIKRLSKSLDGQKSAISRNFVGLHDALLSGAPAGKSTKRPYVIAITLLFLCIELLPLIFKFSMSTRDYDVLLRRQETLYLEYFQAKMPSFAPRDRVPSPSLGSELGKGIYDLAHQFIDFVRDLMEYIKKVPSLLRDVLR